MARTNFRLRSSRMAGIARKIEAAIRAVFSITETFCLVANSFSLFEKKYPWTGKRDVLMKPLDVGVEFYHTLFMFSR